MNFPPLNKSDRDREFKQYTSIIHANVVYNYLFNNMSHRALDKNIIGLDSVKTKGWQSMGILHYIGLQNEHKNIFAHTNIENAIEYLLENNYDSIVNFLKNYTNYTNNTTIIDKKIFDNQFDEEIKTSQDDTNTQRQTRLKNKSKKPKTTEVITVVFKRNPDVVVEVLERANGICEKCNKPAPFVRAKDNTPYLEVHHIKMLADGGDDTIENAIAVCPNCHRELHFGTKN